MNVKHASFRKVVEQGGQRLAEVAVQTDEPDAPSCLAYFRKGPKGYQLVRVIADASDREIDWFNNNLHEAFQDVTDTLFTGPNHMAENDRNVFARQVLASGEVQQEMDRHFETAGR